MFRRVRERIAEPFREQPVRMGLVLIGGGMIGVVLRQVFGFELFHLSNGWISDLSLVLVGSGVLLYAWLRRPPAGGALSLLLLLSGLG